MNSARTIAKCVYEALRDGTVVIGTSCETNEQVLVLVEEQADGTYDYVPLARVMTPVMPTVIEE